MTSVCLPWNNSREREYGVTETGPDRDKDRDLVVALTIN